MKFQLYTLDPGARGDFALSEIGGPREFPEGWDTEDRRRGYARDEAAARQLVIRRNAEKGTIGAKRLVAYRLVAE
jgi:hypothetical protein